MCLSTFVIIKAIKSSNQIVREFHYFLKLKFQYYAFKLSLDSVLCTQIHFMKIKLSSNHRHYFDRIIDIITILCPHFPPEAVWAFYPSGVTGTNREAMCMNLTRMSATKVIQQAYESAYLNPEHYFNQLEIQVMDTSSMNIFIIEVKVFIMPGGGMVVWGIVSSSSYCLRRRI